MSARIVPIEEPPVVPDEYKPLDLRNYGDTDHLTCYECTCSEYRGGPGVHHLDCCPQYQEGIYYVNINTGTGEIVVAESGDKGYTVSAEELHKWLKERARETDGQGNADRGEKDDTS